MREGLNYLYMLFIDPLGTTGSNFQVPIDNNYTSLVITILMDSRIDRPTASRC